MRAPQIKWIVFEQDTGEAFTQVACDRVIKEFSRQEAQEGEHGWVFHAEGRAQRGMEAWNGTGERRLRAPEHFSHLLTCWCHLPHSLSTSSSHLYHNSRPGHRFLSHGPPRGLPGIHSRPLPSIPTLHQSIFKPPNLSRPLLPEASQLCPLILDIIYNPSLCLVLSSRISWHQLLAQLLLSPPGLCPPTHTRFLPPSPPQPLLWQILCKEVPLLTCPTSRFLLFMLQPSSNRWVTPEKSSLTPPQKPKSRSGLSVYSWIIPQIQINI